MMYTYRGPGNDLYSNTYNQGWGGHPNLSWVNNQNVQKAPSGFQPQEQKTNLDDIMAQLASNMNTLTSNMNTLTSNVNTLSVNTKQFMRITDTILQNQATSRENLEVQMRQLAHSLAVREKCYCPSQTEVNPRNHEEVEAITLRRGKQVMTAVDFEENNEEAKAETAAQKTQPLSDVVQPLVIPGAIAKASPQSVIAATPLPKSFVPTVKPYVPHIPFSQRLKRDKLDEKYFKFLDMFFANWLLMIQAPTSEFRSLPDHFKYHRPFKDQHHAM